MSKTGYSGCLAVRDALSSFFKGLSGQHAWWYNILGEDHVTLSELFRAGPATAESILLTAGLIGFYGSGENEKLVVKIKNWEQFINDYDLKGYIEVDPTTVKRERYIFVRIGGKPAPGFDALHTAGDQFNDKHSLHQPSF